MNLAPPAEVSRIALLVLVAAGVAGSLIASGDLASFSRGFAVGAGAALVLSRARRPHAGDGSGESDV